MPSRLRTQTNITFSYTVPVCLSVFCLKTAMNSLSDQPLTDKKHQR